MRYDHIRDFIAKAIASREQSAPSDLTRPSRYWQDFCRFSAYVRGLPDDELPFIRYQTWHLTSDHYQRYYLGSESLLAAAEKEYLFLTGHLNGFRPVESSEGIGFDTHHGKISIDLIRYLGVLKDLFLHGALSRDTRHSVLEIGGGYGGLASLCMQFNSSMAYVICDLEETMFYQAVHLSNVWGSDRVVMCDETAVSLPMLEPGKFYLVPQSRYGLVRTLRFDLALNQQSMQEMSQRQVEHYCDLLSETATCFYSCNQDHGELVRERTQIVHGLNAFLLRRFPEVLWDSRLEMSSLARMSQRSSLTWRIYRRLSLVPPLQISDAQLRRLILRCSPS